MIYKYRVISGILERSWPEFRDIDWSSYGDAYSGLDDDQSGYRTMLFWCGAMPEHNFFSQVFGEVGDSKPLEAMAKRKINLALNHAGTMTSIESHDPEEGNWGGGIRNSTDRFKACALAGQREIPEHVLLAYAMHVPKLLMTNHLLLVTNHLQYKGLQRAMTKAGMAERQYLKLVRDISNLVERYTYS